MHPALGFTYLFLLTSISPMFVNFVLFSFYLSFLFTLSPILDLRRSVEVYIRDRDRG
ncbi:uncharacterized protein LACBIDRAFT_297250 [Laccaria bicolor S238N-H82]|uniref:Predicted protein n=1 Tax=Laccaria bicolor (strain S238N-H82 / ATCC MYA-4686) TaxID=486041 RepID=B0DAC9_LACBS|nr:uncharacterized protein LACBIDRAFT_297250 [Laccaria bicolor S238N-H82]EDR08729.1 predicted protein [Laccaria bicolor S238N-H82]|eukprot:XP_001880954.1 predicted protein [Laccaria bicolor S238N-H82]